MEQDSYKQLLAHLEGLTDAQVAELVATLQARQD